MEMDKTIVIHQNSNNMDVLCHFNTGQKLFEKK